VTSYGIQLGLPRLLGSPQLFGLYSAAMNVVSIIDNVLIAATIQTVSKLVSEDDEAAPGTLRQGLKIQCVVGAALAGGLFVMAPVLGEDVLLDPALTPLLQVGCTVVMAYALYAALVGSLNGHRMFRRQAGLDMAFSPLRTGGILGAAALGFGAIGALSGFAFAAVGILVVGLVVVGTGTRQPGRP